MVSPTLARGFVLRASRPRLPSLALAFGCARSAAHRHQAEPRCAQTSGIVTFAGRSAAQIP
jgi:hypothetical protein